MGDLVVREAYLKRGGFLQLIIILSSAFLRHGFLHSVKAYRRSRLLSCGKSEKILLPVVTNLKTPGLFCFCFCFFFRDKGGAIGWNDQRLFCCARFFFFFTTVATFCKQPPKCQDSVVAYGWSFVKSSLCVRCEQEKKEAARRGVGNRKIAWESSRKHYPDLGRDASSVWNFCARFTDVISREN